jgi:hypothetical protein
MEDGTAGEGEETDSVGDRPAEDFDADVSDEEHDPSGCAAAEEAEEKELEQEGGGDDEGGPNGEHDEQAGFRAGAGNAARRGAGVAAGEGDYGGEGELGDDEESKEGGKTDQCDGAGAGRAGTVLGLDVRHRHVGGIRERQGGMQCGAGETCGICGRKGAIVNDGKGRIQLVVPDGLSRPS